MKPFKTWPSFETSRFETETALSVECSTCECDSVGEVVLMSCCYEGYHAEIWIRRRTSLQLLALKFSFGHELTCILVRNLHRRN